MMAAGEMAVDLVAAIYFELKDSDGAGDRGGVDDITLAEKVDDGA
jgi:hypothetical protein